MPVSRAEPPQDDPSIVEFWLNGHLHGDVVLVRDGEAWLVAQEVLARQGLRWPAQAERVLGRTAVVDVRSMPHVDARLELADPASPAGDRGAEVRRLALSASADAFATQAVIVAPRTGGLDGSARALVINYAATHRGGTSGVATDITTRLGPGLARASLYVSPGYRPMRGPASFIVDVPRHLVRWEVGELFAASPLAQAPRRIVGLAVSRDFSMDTTFFRQNPLDIAGSVETPTTASVYVNGQLVTQTPLDAGGFALRDIPAVVGSGDLRIVLRDVFGRERVIQRDYYRAPAGLRQGLHQYRYTVGVPQAIGGLGMGNDGGGGLVVSAEHRVGVWSWLTLGAMGDGRRDDWQGGPVAVVQTPFGSVESGVVATQRASRQRIAASLAYEYRGRRTTLNTFWRPAPDSGVTGATPSHDVGVNAGVRPFGRLGLSLQHARARDGWGLAQRRTAASAMVGATRRTSVALTVARAGRPDRQEWSAAMTVSLALAGRRAAGVGVTADVAGARATASMTEGLPIGPGFGYAAQWQSGSGLPSGSLTAQGAHGRLELRQDNVAGREVVGVTLSGALVVTPRSVHSTRPIDDAWALVDVPGGAGIPTFISNQFAGRTNARGRLIVPSLASFAPQRISLDQTSMPLTLVVPESDRVVTPAFRSGAVVRFGAVTAHAWVARLVMVTDPGAYRASVSAVMRDARRRVLARSPIGRDGEVYFETDGTPARIDIETPDGPSLVCAVLTPPMASDDGLPSDLGVLTCVDGGLLARGGPS